MQLILLDKDLTRIKTYQAPISTTWTTAFYESGSFQIIFSQQQATPEILQNARFIYIAEYDEVGLIRSWTIDEESNYLVLIGDMCESLYNTRVRNGTNQIFPGSVDVESIAHSMLSSEMLESHFYDKLTLGSKQGGAPTLSDYAVEMGSVLGATFTDILTPVNWSYRTVLDWNNKVLDFKCYSGKDRTTNQTANTRVVFSKKRNNVYNEVMTIDESNYYNIVYVYGKTQDDATEEIPINQCPTDEVGRELRIDTKHSIGDFPDINDWQNAMRDEGIEELAKRNRVISVTFDVDARNINAPFALGDKVTYINDYTGLTLHDQITKIEKVWEVENKIYKITVGKGGKLYYEQ